MQTGFANFFDGKRQVANQDNVVTALHVWAGLAKLVDVQLNAGAVTEAVVFIVTFDRFYFDSAFDAGHALQCFFDYVCLQFALTRKLDVPELCATRATDTGLIPDVLDAVW